MTCEELLALLSDYVDGDLDHEVYRAFQEHLADCGPCQVVVDNVRRTINLYKAGGPVELPQEPHRHLCRVLRDRWKARFPSAEA